MWCWASVLHFQSLCSLMYAVCSGSRLKFFRRNRFTHFATPGRSISNKHVRQAQHAPTTPCCTACRQPSFRRSHPVLDRQCTRVLRAQGRPLEGIGGGEGCWLSMLQLRMSCTASHMQIPRCSCAWATSLRMSWVSTRNACETSRPCPTLPLSVTQLNCAVLGQASTCRIAQNPCASLWPLVMRRLSLWSSPLRCGWTGNLLSPPASAHSLSRRTTAQSKALCDSAAPNQRGAGG